MMRNDATSEDALMGLAEKDVTGERNERNTFVIRCFVSFFPVRVNWRTGLEIWNCIFDNNMNN